MRSRYQEIVDHWNDQRERAQQRVPAGNPDGGQFTSGTVGGLKKGDTFKMGKDSAESEVVDIHHTGSGTSRVTHRTTYGTAGSNTSTNTWLSGTRVFVKASNDPTTAAAAPAKGPSLSVVKSQKHGWPQE